MKKIFTRVIEDRCVHCPNCDYQWDSFGKNGKNICLGSELENIELFDIDANP